MERAELGLAVQGDEGEVGGAEELGGGLQAGRCRRCGEVVAMGAERETMELRVGGEEEREGRGGQVGNGIGSLAIGEGDEGGGVDRGVDGRFVRRRGAVDGEGVEEGKEMTGRLSTEANSRWRFWRVGAKMESVDQSREADLCGMLM